MNYYNSFKVKLIALALALAMLIQFGALCESRESININASGCALLDVATGRFLYEQNGDKKLPMASTTKVMTAIIALENGDPQSIVTVPKEGSGVEGSSIYLEQGEQMTLQNMLLGLMLQSGNDAAVTIACHIGGSVQGFLELMNQKAAELGATNTHFANPNGLPNDEHYTTAKDFAKIAAYAMKNPAFVEIVNTKSATVDWAGHEWDRVFKNKNKFLTMYEGANGVKTGFTKAAGKCFVAAANREGIQLVAVVLNCPDTNGESARLMDYGFSQLENSKVLQKGAQLGYANVKNSTIDTLELVAKDDIVIPLRKGEKCEVMVLPGELTAPVSQGDVIGTVEIIVEGTCIARQKLLANNDAPVRTVGYYFKRLGENYNIGLWG